MPTSPPTFGHPLSTMPATAQALLERVWGQLAEAADSGKHGWHLPVVGTVSHPQPAAAQTLESPQAELRTVVLRWMNKDHRTVGCHTDLRSDKVKQVQRSGWMTWLFYDASLKLQLRASGPTAVEHDTPLAEERWAASNLSSRRCYLAPGKPSTPVDDQGAVAPVNLPEAVQDSVPNEEQTQPGRANFAVIQTVFTQIDVLSLAHSGHERLGVRWASGQPDAEATWAWLLP